MTKLTASTQFINVVVSVRPGDVAGTYSVETAPAVPRVTQKDTVINYQLVGSKDSNIVFTGMTVEPPMPDQFSQASVSVSGKQLTFTDANTTKIPMTFNITLHFQDELGIKFMHDPEVRNEPQTT